MAAFATHPQKAVFETAASEVILKLPLHIIRQWPALPGHVLNQYRVMLFDDPIQKGLCGPVALVTSCRPPSLGTPCHSGEGHD